MTCYYYFDDPKSEFGTTTISEEDYLNAIFKIAEENGVKITQEMILKEVRIKCNKSGKT